MVHNLISPLLLGTVSLLLFANPALGRIVLTEGSSLELIGGSGVYQLNQSSDACRVDAVITPVAYSSKTIDMYTMDTDALDDYGFVTALPQFLTWMHDRYFVNVYGESVVSFQVQYQDQYNNPPSNGYPKVVYWKMGTQDMNYVPLRYESGKYSVSKTIPQGVYQYRYVVKNNYLNEEFCLEISSFVVTARPASPDHPGVQDNQTVTTGKVHLSWDAVSGAGTRYKVYLGNDPLALSCVHEGVLPWFDATSLDPGKTYYWQVETINEFGISTRGSVISFKTLGAIARSYNYPNPFNPARQEQTNVVFMMEDDGSAEISVLSEYGDVVWQQQFDGLNKGSNQIVYQGRDAQGSILYNGTYPCVITKKYRGRECVERCRLLIIK